MLMHRSLAALWMVVSGLALTATVSCGGSGDAAREPGGGANVGGNAGVGGSGGNGGAQARTAHGVTRAVLGQRVTAVAVDAVPLEPESRGVPRRYGARRRANHPRLCRAR